MSIWDKITEAKATGGGVYLKPGSYLVRVDRVEQNRSRKHEDMFIVEMTIALSNNALHPAGSRPSWVCNLTKHESAMGNVKGFAATLFGIDPSDEATVNAQIVPHVMAALCGPAQPKRGTILSVTVTEVPTKKAGGVFSKHQWAAVGPELVTQAMAALVSYPAPALAPPASAPQAPAAPAAWPPAAPAFGGAAPAVPPVPGLPPALPAWPGVPVPPAAPPIPVAPPAPPAFPPPGWITHPTPGYFYRGQQVVTESELRSNPGL